MTGTADGRRRLVRRLIAAGAVVVLVAQAVPYGWWHENPPVVVAAVWPDPASEELARAACYDCHSNETRWPAYSYVAPMSWLVRRDVEAGRDELNFSDWDAGDADDAIDAMVEGGMPPTRYTLIHRDASLSAEETAAVVAALAVMEAAD